MLYASIYEQFDVEHYQQKNLTAVDPLISKTGLQSTSFKAMTWALPALNCVFIYYFCRFVTAYKKLDRNSAGFEVKYSTLNSFVTYSTLI